MEGLCNLLSADQTMPCWKAQRRPVVGRLAVYPGLSNDRPWDNYRQCIVVKHKAHWPTMYSASVPARNARLRRVFMLDIIAVFAAHQWTRTMLDGRRIHKFVMTSSRTETESTVFSPKPAETGRLQLEILRTVTTLIYSKKLSYKPCFKVRNARK